MTAQLLKLVKIGNSRGVRLPKELLASFPTTDTFSWLVEGGCIMLKPAATSGVPPVGQWARLIEEALANHGDDGDDFRDWDATVADGLDDH